MYINGEDRCCGKQQQSGFDLKFDVNLLQTQFVGRKLNNLCVMDVIHAMLMTAMHIY